MLKLLLLKVHHQLKKRFWMQSKDLDRYSQKHKKNHSKPEKLNFSLLCTALKKSVEEC